MGNNQSRDAGVRVGKQCVSDRLDYSPGFCRGRRPAVNNYAVFSVQPQNIPACLANVIGNKSQVSGPPKPLVENGRLFAGVNCSTAKCIFRATIVKPLNRIKPK